MYFCDFCNVPMESLENNWTYHSRPSIMLIPNYPIGMIDEDGEWLTCDICASLIEAGNQQGLEDRAVNISMGEFKDADEKIIRLAVHTVHAGFWKTKREESIGSIL